MRSLASAALAAVLLVAACIDIQDQAASERL